MKRKKDAPRIPVSDLPAAELFAILERTRQGALPEHDHTKLKAAIDTLVLMTQEVAAKNASMRRLKEMLFGSRTEKTSAVLGETPKEMPRAGKGADAGAEENGRPPKKRKGHGRNGVIAYPGATRIPVPHEALKHGARCPECDRGNVYDQSRPAQLIRVVGVAPISASVYECARLRCNGCGKVFTAAAPEGVGAKKYDESVAALVALMKYGCGVPFHRLEKFQEGLGIPLPASTQWELVDEALDQVEPAFEELVRQAAQAEVLHNDDTTMKILGYDVEQLAQNREEERMRTGTFTSGIIARAQERVMALFYTGRNHAGENLAEVLSHREKDLGTPTQMCDALSRNTKGAFKTILSNCMAHARRRFVEVVDAFPEECRFVLETLREVYHHDEISREEKMTPQERLRLHQERSAPLMEVLADWMAKQFEEQLVEPNSTLGEAITYMQGHWAPLTLFLREPGAPLDNNICERALKKAILHRKNSMFYKTENGARAGDIFMSLIHTTELNDGNPFDYLTSLMRNAERVRAAPAAWMPWTYRETLKNLQPSGP